MKLKAFFEKLKADGKINSAELQTVIETAPEFELPDKAVEAFEGSFFTLDRAATHKDVRTKLQTEMLMPFERDVKKILSTIDGVDKFKASEIDKLEGTYQKSGAITEYLPEMINKLKTTTGNADEETKKQLKVAKESVQELMSKLEHAEAEKTKREKFLQADYDKKINDYEINADLEKLANSFTFGKAYSDPQVRKDITKVKLDAIRAQYPLSRVVKDGQTVIQVNDSEGKPRFLENSNTPVLITKVLEDSFKPYIKASNVDDDKEDQEDKRQATKRFSVNDGDKPRQGARTTVQ